MRGRGIGPADLQASALPRRRAVNRLMEALATLAALVAIAVLAVMIFSVARRGASQLNLDLLTKVPHPGSFVPVDSGLANAFAGTLLVVAIATAIALPFGILVAVYLNEFARPVVRDTVSLALDVLNGIPAIVIGIFVYGLIVIPRGQSAWAAGFALAILMLPLLARATQEVLALVPNSTREASLALGVPRWRTTLSIVLPQTIGGVITGTTLAVARVAGETAPLLFTSSLLTSNDVSWNAQHAVFTVPLAIFEYSESPDPNDHALAWAAALVLLMFILLASLGARALAARSRRRLGMSR